ncbi:DUF333 domain-containing protein [Nannocystaceae bacterium ST9]
MNSATRRLTMMTLLLALVGCAKPAADAAPTEPASTSTPSTTTPSTDTPSTTTPASDPAPETKPEGGTTQMANPASVNCEQKGGKLEMVTNADGEQGICVLADGTRCEEWAYMRGECP